MIDNVIVLSDLVESSGYSSKTLQKGSCPYAPLDEVLWYIVCLCVAGETPFSALKISSSAYHFLKFSLSKAF